MILKTVLTLILLLILGDSVSTYLCLTQVPGGQESNPLVIPLINLIGIGPAMWISGAIRAAGAVWLHRMASTGDQRKRVIVTGFTFVIVLTLYANVNNWLIWLEGAV